MADTMTTATVSTKAMVPEPRFFDGTRSKFEDWWRAMVLYLKYNKVTDADDKATTILA